MQAREAARWSCKAWSWPAIYLNCWVACSPHRREKNNRIHHTYSVMHSVWLRKNNMHKKYWDMHSTNEEIRVVLKTIKNWHKQWKGKKKKKESVAGKAKPHSVLQVACNPVYSKYRKCLQNPANLWTGVQRTNQTMFSWQYVQAPTRCSKLGGVILLYTACIAGAKSCKIDKIYQEDVDRTERKI